LEGGTVEGEGGGDGARKRERHMGLKRMESVLGRLVFGFFFIGASGPWYYYYFYGSAGAWYSVFFHRSLYVYKWIVGHVTVR
jgi:hypothetical protein